MSQKITRVSLTLPKKLLDELDRTLKTQDYASRSEAVRDALRDFLASYKWRQGLKGELVGVIVIVYEHDARMGIMTTVQHVHLDAKTCLETLIVRGSAKKIRRLVDQLGALRGVKQAKLVTVEK
jgi:CopG family nickel-responsive transcriptional regulator